MTVNTGDYKGSSKYTQPDISIFPGDTVYVSSPVNDSFSFLMNSEMHSIYDSASLIGADIAAIIPGKGVWGQRLGWMSLSDSIPLDSTHSFYWASVAKLFTGTLIAKFVESEKLSYDDKLSTWFPLFVHADVITIEQLLAHTSGLNSFNSDSTFQKNKRYYAPEEILQLSLSQANVFYPGQYWHYSNTGYYLLALILEKIEGKPFHEILNENISLPLNLHSLQVIQPNQELPELVLDHQGDSSFVVDHSTPLGAGNMIGNAREMALFLKEYITGNVIPLQSMHEHMNNLYPMFSSGTYYGRGIMLYNFLEINGQNKIWIGHSGGTETYKSLLIYDVNSRIIISMVMNHSAPAEAIALKLISFISKL